MKNNMSAGKRVWRIIYPILIYIACQYVVQFAYIFVKMFDYLKIYGIETAMSESGMLEITDKLLGDILNDTLIITLTCNLLVIGVLFAVYMNDKKKTEAENPLHLNTVRSPLTYFLNVSVSASSCIVGNIFLSYIVAIAVAVFGENITASYDYVADAIGNSNVALQLFCVVLIGPIAEELLMRGIVFKRLRSGMNAFGAAVISSCIFGLIHGNWVQFIYAFIIGIIAAYIYEFTRNLAAPIVFHIVANGISTVASQQSLSPYFENMMFGVTMSLTVLLCLTSIITGLTGMKLISDKYKN